MTESINSPAQSAGSTILQYAQNAGNAILSGVQTAGKMALDAGNTVVKALGRVVEYMGTTLSAAAKKIAEWAKIFIQDKIPLYYQIIKDFAKLSIKTLTDYAKLGINYLRENKSPVAIGAVIGAATLVTAYGIGKLFHKSSDV